MMKSWENAADCEQIIREFQAMRVEAGKRSLSLKLLENIILTAAFAAFLTALLAKHGRATLVGWAPDRDKITESYKGIAATMFSTNVSSICQQWSLSVPSTSIFVQTQSDLWCDPYIRLTDYLAGTAASNWDHPGTKVPRKIAQLLTRVFADNPYLFVFPIAFSHVGGRLQCQVYRTRMSTHPLGPHQQGKRFFDRQNPIHGRSREKQVVD